MIGTVISHYQVLRLLGKGGMGEVYEAADNQIGRRVAIKVLLPRFADDPEIVGRFFNEARSVNFIDHPSLVQVFEFGQMPTGGAFLVMEYLAGVSLSEQLKESRQLPEMEVLQIALQLASALAAAHAKDIVHRDLKPSNVMILLDPTMPGGKRVKLLDFGIAKLGANMTQEDQPRTRTGSAIGTPLYMSPEQGRGSKVLDGKSDVYSLGVMLYQLLAGKLPFDGEGDGEVIGKHMYEEPPPLMQWAPGVSPSVATLIHRMLHKRAAERPSAQEVEEILREMAAAELPLAIRNSAKLTTVKRLSGSNPSAESASNPSTLGRSVGQLPLLSPRRLRYWLRGRRAKLITAVGGALFLGLWLVVGLVTLQPKAVEKVPADLPLTKVRWMIKSSPSGARVVTKHDRTLLGQTPWVKEQPASGESLEVVLQLDGYKTRVLRFDGSRDAVVDVTMEPDAKVPEPALRSPKDSAKRGHRGKQTRLVE